MNENELFEMVMGSVERPVIQPKDYSDTEIEYEGMKLMRRKFGNGTKKYRVIEDPSFQGKWHFHKWEALDAFYRFQKLVHLKSIGVIR